MGKWRYGVILDAGSSGTRVYVYRWLNNAAALHDADDTELRSLPRLHTKKKWTKKIHPGVSTFGDHPEDVGPEHLQELLDHALSIVPKGQIADTPFFLMATAGVRLLEQTQQKDLLKQICSYARRHSDFSLPDCDLHIQVIPGDTEGLYGWMAANYLLGGFDVPDEHDHGKGHHTYGFLDMGGASAQIAFAPNRTEAIKHANDLTLLRMRTLNGQAMEYKVFTTTWLGFGVNQARHRFVEALQEETYTKSATELLDPCLHNGLKTTLDGAIVSKAGGKEPILVGTGLFDECIRKSYPLLDKDAPCADTPCLLHGQHVPAIDFNVNHFVGVSEYWHTTHEVFSITAKDKTYNLEKYQALVKEFCGQDWSTIAEAVDHGKWGKHVDLKTAKAACFKASWLINVLHDGIGVPRIGAETHGPGGSYNASHDLHSGSAKDRTESTRKGFLDPFQAVDKIDDMEVSWTLGKMLLYAAGQIQPATAASTMNELPVGFGSNVAGGVIPSDFQYAGSSANFVPIGGDDEEWSDTADDLLEHAAERSTPTALMFLILFAFFIFLLRKREVRARVFHSASTFCSRRSRLHRRPGSPRKPSRGGSGGSASSFSKFFGYTGTAASRGSYDRVSSSRALEDGTAMDNFFDAGSDDYSGDDGFGGGGESSDSSADATSVAPQLGHSSGLATPKLGNGSGDGGFESYFDAVNNTLGVGGNRAGMREGRASNMGGRRSRAASPSRARDGV